MNCTLVNAQTNPMWYTGYNGKDYLRIPIRMHIHFNPIITPVNEGVAYGGSIYAPYKFTAVRPKIVKAMSLNVEHAFFVQGRDFYGVDYNSYVSENLHKLTAHPIWETKKAQLIQEYIDKVCRTCGVLLSPESVDYSVQFCWKSLR